MQEIINKIKEWKKAIDDYDKATFNAAEITSKLFEAKNGKETWKIDDLQTKHENGIKEIEKQDDVTRKLQEEAILIASNEIDNKSLRGSIIQMLVSSPDFAGLDEKAFDAISNNDPSMETVAYVHQIYVEHSQMIANKILEKLSSN